MPAPPNAGLMGAGPAIWRRRWGAWPSPVENRTAAEATLPSGAGRDRDLGPGGAQRRATERPNGEVSLAPTVFTRSVLNCETRDG